MESLEVVLRKVESLRSGLIAEICVGGHQEEGKWVGGSRDGSNPGYWEDEPGWVNDYAPDTQKREATRTELQQIYDSSEWYSARYVAGTALSIPKHQLETQINQWIDF